MKVGKGIDKRIQRNIIKSTNKDYKYEERKL
jgi:hypothetical protein